MDSFIAYHPKTNELLIEQIPLTDLIKQYGTPLYCYSARAIERAIDDYQTALQKENLPVHIHYAVKANNRLAILSIMKQREMGLDVVSVGEIMAGLKVGFSAGAMIYSGVGKTKDDIAYAIKQNIGQLNIESFDEITMLLDIIKTNPPEKALPVAVRLNPDIAIDSHAKISTGKKGDKFGIEEKDILSAYQLLAGTKHILPHGLAMHIGSQLRDVGFLTDAYQKLLAVHQQLQKAGHDISSLDIGGGLAIAYHLDPSPLPLPDYAKLLKKIFAPVLDSGVKKIIIEPGRSLVGSAGLLLTSVILQKQSGDRHITVVDAAMNDLIRPTLYHAEHDILPITKKARAERTQDIVGGICETGDYLAMARKLQILENGEALAILQAGAYGSAMVSNYNSRPFPAEVLVRGKEHTLIKERQTMDDIFALERNYRM